MRVRTESQSTVHSAAHTSGYPEEIPLRESGGEKEVKSTKCPFRPEIDHALGGLGKLYGGWCLRLSEIESQPRKYFQISKSGVFNTLLYAHVTHAMLLEFSPALLQKELI